MANLVDRIQNPVTRETVEAGGETMIPIHQFTAALNLYYEGEATENQIRNLFNLDASAQTQLSAVIAALNGQADDLQKLRWINKLESAGLYYESGVIDSAQYKTIMGF